MGLLQLAMEASSDIPALCGRLAGLSDLPFPTRRSECEGDEPKEYTVEEKQNELEDYFRTSPARFLQRYHRLINPKEVVCFNQIPQSEEAEYYIREICQRKNIEARSALDKGFTSQEVKNRRYRALQKMIKDGDYFGDEAMEKRNPKLYQEYIGRFLTTEEKQDKLKESAAARPPLTLVNFFMEVIDRKEEAEEELDRADDEEFDTDSEEEEEDEATVANIPDEEKEYLREEFRSRMYQNFLDGLDKDFSYKAVDDNTEYDDLEQLGQDEQDAYFDEEEPSASVGYAAEEVEKQAESEDELDQYMKTVEKMVTEETPSDVT